MGTVFCPSCSQLVRRSGTRCPDCGSDLEFTVREADETRPPLRPDPRQLEFSPGQSFAGRFTIIERVGAGGMGVVYKAIDTALDIEVAVKLIQPSLARLPNFAEWFRREVRLTRQITHPNISRVHDIGESEGILFLSMEWIEGETLQQLLKQTGMLTEGRALQIAEKIAAALEAAHAKDIIHRDLKPANVMLDRRGHVRVLDFGLAALQGVDEPSEEGVLIGSPYYMSPEQRERQALDARTDFYALGLILREMLLGTRLDPVPGLTREIRAVINPAIHPVLERLLAEKREERCRSASEARRLLRRALDDPAISTVASAVSGAPALRRRRARYAWIAAAVLASAGVLGWMLWPKSPPAFRDTDAATFYQRARHYLREEAETVRTIDDAITMLNRAHDLEPDNPSIWAALGEAHWLRFRHTGSAQARDEAERAVDRALKLDAESPEALFARALGFAEEGKYRAAKTDLERAIALRPDFAMAWGYLGTVEQELGSYAAARDAHERSVQLEPTSFRLHLYYGLFHDHFGEYDAASRHYRRATELKPGSVIAWNNLGASLLYTGRFQQAIPALERSLAIEDSGGARSNLGTALYYLGRLEDAVEQYRRATELESGRAVHWANLGDALAKLARGAEARAAYHEAADRARNRTVLSPLDPTARAELALYCAKGGDASCALQESAVAADLQPDSAAIVFSNARVYCLLGRDEQALDLLESAVRLGVSRSEIEAAPELERLADHPRFVNILERTS